MTVTRTIRRFATAALACMALLLPATASAQCEQTGNFSSFEGPWHDFNGAAGYFFPNGSTMVVDTDGDGVTSPSDPQDHVYAVPATIQSNRLISVLSPTREFFVVVGGTPVSTCDSNRSVRIYRLDQASGTMVLVHQDCLPCTVFEGPLFYDLGIRSPYPYTPAINGQRIAMFRTATGFCNPNNQAPPLLRWYDLNTPGPSGIADTSLGLHAGINPNTLRVSPSGYQAFVQHDLTNNPADSDFDIINLCQGPNFGVIVPNAIGPNINDYAGFPLPIPVISSATAGAVTLQMRVDSTVIYQADVTNCCAGAPTGACCVNGGCVVTTQAQCSGTWAAVPCEQADCPPAPTPIVSLTMTGPGIVEQQGFVDYVLTYRNDGGAPATNVVVRDRLPNAFTFVSAGGGGAYDQNQHEVTWTIGTLPAQSGPRTLTLRTQAGCNTSFNTNAIYRISGTGFSINGSPAVQTYVTTATVVGSVSGSVTTVTAADQPLLPGSVLHHEVILTNTSSVQLAGIRFAGAAGTGARFTALVDHGTGVLAMPFGGGSYLEWTGNLAPAQSTTIRFDSTINSCSSAQDTHTQLNAGNPWVVSTYCGALLGSFPTSPSLTIQPPMSASLSASLVPGEIGPVIAGTDVYQSPMQLVRGTPAVDLILAVSNATGAPINGANLTLELPFSWAIADPPFMGSVPEGFSYDANTFTVVFNGDVPAAGLPPVTIRIQPDAPIIGAMDFSVYRSIPELCSVILAELSLVNLPALPEGPVILGVEKFYQSGLWSIRPAIDPAPSFYFNRSELWRGMHKEPSGDLWLAGGPIFMINPDTLAAGSAPGVDAFLQGLGLAEIGSCDIAVDPIDGSLVIMVDQRTDMNNITHPPALIRYNRATATCTLLTRDPVLLPTNRHADVLIDPAGTIYIANRQVLARIPRSMPVPVPDGQVPLVAVPHPAYAFGPGAGALTTQRVHAAGWSCDGHLILLHASTFVGGTSPDGFSVDTELYALSTYDSVSNTITVVQPQLAANSFGQGNRGWPVEFNPQLPEYGILSDSCITGGESGQTLVANNFYPFHSIYAVDMATGATTPIEPAEGFHFRGAADIAYFHGSCSTNLPCDSDFNGDGDFGTDADIEAFFACLAGSCCPACDPNGADFNGDGDVGTDADIEAFFRVLAGGNC